MSNNILDRIIVQKKKEMAQRKQSLPLASLKESIGRRHPPLDFAHAVGGNNTRIIAEVKRVSPSRGVLCPDFNPVALAKDYSRGGAAAISVLTEISYFEGSLEHLAAIREEIHLPLLRKDFIFDPYQVYESRAFGADALLLIAAILSQEELYQLLALSHSLGLGCLVEVHNEAEVEKALLSEAKIIGINNRDLHTFAVDIETTHHLRPFIPYNRIVVSESGIRNRDDVKKLQEWEVNAILVGETLVTARDIPTKMKELLM